MIKLNDKQLEMLEWAKFYLKKGISVIPVNKSKIPLIPWREFQNRVATLEEADKWWETYPDAQLGMVTGLISGISVVDIEEGGDWSFLPQDTTIAKTGGNGRHYFFKYHAGLGNKARIKDLIDFRSDGGYVIVSPSVSDKGSYEWISKANMLDFPVHLFPELTVPSEGKMDMSGVSSLKMTSDAFIEMIDKYEGQDKGSRNSKLTSMAGYLMNRTHPLHWQDEVLPALLEANKHNNPPLPNHEVLGIFRSIVETDVNNPISRWVLKEKEIKEEVEGEEELDVQLMSVVADREKINVSEYWPTGIEVFDNALGGGLIPGDLITVAAMSGQGKTTFAQFLARNFILDQRKVLFISYEVLVQHVWERFLKMNIPQESLVYAPIKNKGNMGWVKQVIEKAIRDFDVKIVIIDHLGFLEPEGKSGYGQLSDNYSVYLTKIVRQLKTLAKELEIAIVMPVHMRKRSAMVKKNSLPDINEIQSSAGIAQESDAVFVIMREETVTEDATDLHTSYTKIQLTKNRRGSSNPSAWFLLNEAFIFCKQDEYFGIEEEIKKEKLKKKAAKVDYKSFAAGEVPLDNINNDLN